MRTIPPATTKAATEVKDVVISVANWLKEGQGITSIEVTAIDSVDATDVSPELIESVDFLDDTVTVRLEAFGVVDDVFIVTVQVILTDGQTRIATFAVSIVDY